MRLRDALKAIVRFSPWGGQSAAGSFSGSLSDWMLYGGHYPGSSYDYRAAVGRISESPVVQAAVAWMQRACTEPPLQVVKTEASGEENEVPDHPLTALLRRPNPHTTGRQLWQQTISDWMCSGNAYWLKVRNGAGEVVELWQVPEVRMRPQWPTTGTTFISEYLHSVGSVQTRIPIADVVHFRFGKHPDNERLGWSPVLAGLREIAALNEGANYRGALLRNRAVASHFVSSKDPSLPFNREQAQALESLWISKTGGDGSGRPIFSSTPAEIVKLGYSPSELDLGTMLNYDSDLVCSLFGLSSMVVGVSSGSEHKTYANFAEARESAFEQAVVPALLDLAETLDLQLLADFGDVDSEKVAFDLSKVRILQEDQSALYDRLDKAVKTGWITKNEARSFVNLPAIEGGDELGPTGGGGGFGNPNSSAGGGTFESSGDRIAVETPESASPNGAARP